jgi:hypothetical protein
MATTEFEPSGRSPLEDFPPLWQRVITDPLGFYATMPETGGLGAPTVFLAICAGINAIGHLLFLSGLFGMVAIFIWQIVAAFVIAAFFVLIAQNLFAGRGGFEATFRVVAYAWAPLVIAWAPVVGKLALIYTIYLLIRGLERVQGLDATRAVLTVVLGAGVLVLLGIVGVGPTWL